MRVSALPELQAYPPSFSPPPKAAMEAREFIRVRLHERLYQWRQEQGLHRKRDHLQVNDISTCLAMVQSGIGWAVLPEICLKEFDGVIRPLSFSDGTRFTRETHLLYRPEYLELPQVSLFLESVLKAEGKQISL